jgi:EAL domain-containing protein (putative c-di-GMP-specific phosphodiesterase class I)
VRDIPAALEGAVDRGEIVAWFQPQVDLEHGGIVGAEALCRWQHPEWGAVPPAEFIAVAEETGAIDAIGQRMAEECFDALAEWNDLAGPIDVSVNVSPLQLHGSSFTDWLAARLAGAGLRRGRLTIEITESHPLEDVPALVPRLDRLRRAGLGIAVDDFGVGQSSLLQLRRLHGTELKIDRSLVIDLSAATTTLLQRAVQSAHEIGIRVVAEGIETIQHLQRIRDLGCDRAQGYLLGRPMPRNEFAALLTSA